MNASAVPMTDNDLATLLLGVAHSWHLIHCNDDTCAPCVFIRRVWWDTYSRLTTETWDRMMDCSLREDILYPPTPPVEVTH